MALIEQEALLEVLDKYVNPMPEDSGNGFLSGIATAISCIEDAPTIDAAPVVHGRWEEVDWVEPDGHGFGTVRTPKAGLRCNQCANVFKKELLWKDSFCPNCSARMDGGEGHESN